MKLKELSILVGQTITNVSNDNDYSLRISLSSGKMIDLELSDEGPQNDSHAWISSFDLDIIKNQEIIEAYEESKDSSHAHLILKTKDHMGSITITHEHNGYYDFSYDLIEV